MRPKLRAATSLAEGHDRAGPGIIALRAPMPRFHHELLRQLRLDLDLGQEEAAAALGVDVRTYRRYESGAVNEGGPFAVRNASRRRLLRRMCEELGVAEESDWIVPDKPSPAASVATGHALQRAPHFVGRADDLAALARWVADPDARVLAVLGIGGAGKTALVERFLAAHGAGAFVHSFYDDPRTEAVIAELTRDDGAGLAVLDGLEVMQSEGGNGRAFGELEDPALRRALRSAAAGVASRKVLVTSRLPLTDLAPWAEGVRTLPLAPLTPAESTALLRAWGLTGDERALAPLAEASAGHALSVAMVGSYASTFLGCDPGLATELLPAQIAGDDPLARRLSSVLEAYAARLPPGERDLLARLSLFAGAADRDLLVSLGGGDARAVLGALARLERLGLVARTPAGVTAHPFVRGHFKSLLAAPQDGHAGLARASLAGPATTRVADGGLLDEYERVLAHTRAAGGVLEAWGIYLRAMGGFDNLGLRVGAMTLGARVLAGFTDGGSPERVDPRLDGEARAGLLYDWGLYAGALGDPALALRCHEAHLRCVDASRWEASWARRSMGLRTLAYVAWVAGDLARAGRALDESIALAEAGGDAFHLARGYALYAMVAHDAGDGDASARWSTLAGEVERSPSARRALWAAELRLDAGDHRGARELAAGALEDCARRGWAGHGAHAETLVGLSWAGDDPARASACLARAWPWARRSQEVELWLRCHELAAAVAAVEGRSDDAARERRRGLATARSHGFGRFERRFTG
jgi:transcriptional regulator with XRE-family HTH domain